MSSIEIAFAEGARRIFVFDEVFSERAAREQAEKRKLGAFGTMARVQSMIAGGPKPETVALAKSELRYEPFWQVAAQRSVDYLCQIDYKLQIDNPQAQRVRIGEWSTEVVQQGSKRSISVPAIESCHRNIQFSTYLDGLKRELRSASFETYFKKSFKVQEVQEMRLPNAVPSLLPVPSVVQIATSRLTGEAISAHEITQDRLVIDQLFLYWRPVFAFEYLWTTNGRSGVVEIDGLTGEGIANGQWFKDKLECVFTREMLVDLSSEVAGGLVPGGGAAIKIIDKLL